MDGHWATVPLGVEGGHLPWGGVGQQGEGASFVLPQPDIKHMMMYKNKLVAPCPTVDLNTFVLRNGSVFLVCVIFRQYAIISTIGMVFFSESINALALCFCNERLWASQRY